MPRVCDTEIGEVNHQLQASWELEPDTILDDMLGGWLLAVVGDRRDDGIFRINRDGFVKLYQFVHAAQPW